MFLKQPRDFQPHLLAAQRREATFCSLVHQKARLALFGHVPRVLHHDQHARTLALEAFPDHQDLSQHSGEPSAWCRVLGKFLARLHSFRSFQMPSDREDVYVTLPLFAVLVLRVDDACQAMNRAMLDVRDRVDQDARLTSLTQRVYENWQRTTMIHGDLRDTNVLTGSPPSSNETTEEPHQDLEHQDLRVIDWELVQRGDPAWDIASVFFMLLTRVTSEDTASRSFSERTPQVCDLGFRQFIDTYQNTAAVSQAEIGHRLARTMPLVAIRCIQAAMEHAFGGEAQSERSSSGRTTDRYLALAAQLAEDEPWSLGRTLHGEQLK